MPKWSKPVTGRGRGGVKPKPAPTPKPAAKPFKLFSPEQERANAKALEALKGIRKNLQTANDTFRKKK